MKVALRTGTLHIEKSAKLTALVGFGSRINAKRGFLFVSKVLGKHLPVKPSVMQETYRKLASLIPYSNLPTLFIGFAETATALGQGVFEEANLTNSFYIHSTRFKTSSPLFFSFFETHCHAPSHLLYLPKDTELQEALKSVGRVILIDDEVSTGNTANNLISQLKPLLPQVEDFYLLTILNWSQQHYESYDYLSLYQGAFAFEPKPFEALESVVSEPEVIEDLDAIIPYNFGRYGTKKLDLSFEIDIALLQNKKVLVLGTAEFMYPPYLFALYLESCGIECYFQATTRSPVNVDGAITSKISFKDNYLENIDNFLYNVIDRMYDKVYVCYETTTLPANFELKKILESYFEVEEIFMRR